MKTHSEICELSVSAHLIINKINNTKTKPEENNVHNIAYSVCVYSSKCKRFREKSEES